MRPYPPVWARAETLGYLLDLSASTVRDYARRSLLPPPQKIGNVPRWSGWVRSSVLVRLA